MNLSIDCMNPPWPPAASPAQCRPRLLRQRSLDVEERSWEKSHRFRMIQMSKQKLMASRYFPMAYGFNHPNIAKLGRYLKIRTKQNGDILHVEKPSRICHRPTGLGAFCCHDLQPSDKLIEASLSLISKHSTFFIILVIVDLLWSNMQLDDHKFDKS